jgi:hypothetical protein
MVTFIKIWIRVLRGIPSQWEYETSHGETLKESIWQMRNYISRNWETSISGWKYQYQSQKETNKLVNELKQENKELYKKWKKRKKIAWL